MGVEGSLPPPPGDTWRCLETLWAAPGDTWRCLETLWAVVIYRGCRIMVHGGQRYRMLSKAQEALWQWIILFKNLSSVIVEKTCLKEKEESSSGSSSSFTWTTRSRRKDWWLILIGSLSGLGITSIKLLDVWEVRHHPLGWDSSLHKKGKEKDSLSTSSSTSRLWIQHNHLSGYNGPGPLEV